MTFEERTQPDVIRRQMAEIRADLREDIGGIVHDTRLLTDWRHYVRAFPWATLAAMAAAGFLAVPRRPEVIQPDAELLRKLAEDGRVEMASRMRGIERPTFTVTLVSLAGNMLLRAGMAFAGQQLGKAFGEHAATGSESPLEARTS